MYTLPSPEWGTIPTMFRRNDKGLVVPTMTESCQWVLTNESALMTIKIDGVCVRVSYDTEWRISKRMGTDAFMKTNKEDDPILFEAFNNQEVKSTGIYEVYGKDIHGNPYNIDKNLMIRIGAADFQLVVGKGNTNIKRGPTVTAEELYTSIQRELADSPEIEGLVFHLEESDSMKLKAAAKIKRTDYGMPWPVPPIVVVN